MGNWENLPIPCRAIDGARRPGQGTIRGMPLASSSPPTVTVKVNGNRYTARYLLKYDSVFVFARDGRGRYHFDSRRLGLDDDAEANAHELLMGMAMEGHLD